MELVHLILQVREDVGRLPILKQIVHKRRDLGAGGVRNGVEGYVQLGQVGLSCGTKPSRLRREGRVGAPELLVNSEA